MIAELTAVDQISQVLRELNKL